MLWFMAGRRSIGVKPIGVVDKNGEGGNLRRMRLLGQLFLSRAARYIRFYPT